MPDADSRLASIKCHILWSNFNGIVAAAMATLMNYIVSFLCHMLVRRLCMILLILILILIYLALFLLDVLLLLLIHSLIIWISIFDFILYHRSFCFSLTHSFIHSLLVRFCFLVHHDGANALHTSFQWQVTSFFLQLAFLTFKQKTNKKNLYTPNDIVQRKRKARREKKIQML